MIGVIEQRYDEHVMRGQFERDPAQVLASRRFDALEARLKSYAAASRRRFTGLFSSSRPEAPSGLYLFGAVGRGKTMLMDVFFENCKFTPKRRTHFHEFMAEVHDRIRAARAIAGGDPIPRVARDIAVDAGLLCFDELHVTDIADAMILGRLFENLFEQGVVVVATSNAHPGALYKDGLNRQLFMPFIKLLENRMEVLELVSAKDFRLDKITGEPLYFTPSDANAKAGLDAHWNKLTGCNAGMPVVLDVRGRALHVPQASMGVARFSFDELCDKPLGPNDFLHLARTFHTLILDGIPVLDPSRRNAARRFINLIDTLYDNGVCLIASADGAPNALYLAGDGADLFERTASRLIEMRSEAYVSSRGRANRL